MLELKDGIGIGALVLSAYNTYVARRSKRRRITLEVIKQKAEKELASGEWVADGFTMNCTVKNVGEVPVFIIKAGAVVGTQSRKAYAEYPIELKPGNSCELETEFMGKVYNDISADVNVEFVVMDGLKNQHRVKPLDHPPANNSLRQRFQEGFRVLTDRFRRASP